MKTATSSWMPPAADESTLLKLIHEMLALDVRIERLEGGLRMSLPAAADCRAVRCSGAELIENTGRL